MDPTERHRFLNLLAEIGSEVVVILSTHIVEDVRELCRNMAIIDQGQVVLTGDPARVLEAVRGRIWRKAVNKGEVEAFKRDFDFISARLVAGQPVIHIYSESAPGDGFSPTDATLEDVYFHRLKGRPGAAKA